MAQHITSINVRVDDETKTRIQKIADFYEKTISEIVREWYDECLEREEEIMRKVQAELAGK